MMFKLKVEAAVTLHNNQKIAILALTPTLNLTQTVTLGLPLKLILTQTQNLTQTLKIIKKTKKSKGTNEHSLYALLFSL